jgi:hypothetical protein
MSKLALDAILARLDALERRVLGHARRRVTKAEKARLEGVSTRTIARRVDAGLLEQPEIINGRWYFWVDEAGQPERGITDTDAMKTTRNRLRRPATTESREAALK